MNIPEITPEELRARIDANDVPHLIDVREPHEPGIADLPAVGQRLIPMGEITGRLDELPKDEEIILYCRSGGRSGNVVAFLLRQGYDVKNLNGGVLRWREDVDPPIAAYCRSWNGGSVPDAELDAGRPRPPCGVW